MNNATQQTLINVAKHKFGFDWFDGDDLLQHFHEDCAGQLYKLVESGVFEAEGHFLRVKKIPR